MPNLLIVALLATLGAAAAIQVVSATVPASTPRNILMIAIAAAAGIFILNRVANAEVSPARRIEQMKLAQTAP